ncbi:MAG TPA: hypothetical protein VFO38_00335 [Candidatus Saccharimonadales bacterium]|nr:hypothetical protein [Candidatus Saccharimonadales bacterium]
MRKIIAVVLAVLAAACTAQPVKQVEHTPVDRSVIEPDVASRFSDHSEFPQAQRYVLGGDVNASMPLHRFGGGTDIGGMTWPNLWQAYTTPVMTKYSELKDAPALVEVVEAAEGSSAEQLCAEGELKGKPLDAPLYCKENTADQHKPGYNPTLQEALVVLPEGFTVKMRGFAVANTAKHGWLLATVVAGLGYAQHLRSTYQPFIGWPAGSLPDSCVAGMSARAVFPKAELTPELVKQTFDELNKLVPPPADASLVERVDRFLLGFSEGRLESC